MITPFEGLLESLGKVFQLELHVDHMSACSIQVQEGLILQLEPDISQEYLWLFCKIIEIPPGKFRENVLSETLKANGLADPRAGHFGLWNGILILFQKYPISLLNGELLSGLIGAFLEMAGNWQKAVQSGRSAPQGPK